MSLATETKQDAMSVLLNLEERVRMSGAVLPRVVDERERWSGIRCSIAGLNGILPLNDVAEILEGRTLTAIPGCVDWVKGVLNLRGRLLPVFDVDDYFGLNERSTTASQVVVVDRAEVFCGLSVNRILGMRKFYSDSFSALSQESVDSNPVLSTLSEFVEAAAVLDEPWYQMNIEKLARRIIQTSPV